MAPKKPNQSEVHVPMTRADGVVVDAVTGQPLVQPPTALEAEHDNDTAEVGVEVKSKLSLAELQGKIERGLPNVAEKMDIDLEKFDFEFPKDVSVPKSLFELKELESNFQKILEKGFNAKKEVFKGSKDMVISFLPSAFKEQAEKYFLPVAIPAVAKKLSEQLAKRVLDTFSEIGEPSLPYRFIKKWPGYNSGDLTYKIVAGKKGFEIKVTPEGRFDKTKYDQFVKVQVESDEAKAAEKAKLLEKNKRTLSLEDKVGELEDSPLAFLGMMMKPGEDYDGIMQEIAAGKSPMALFWQFVAGMMGVPAFAESAEKMIAKLPEDVRKNVLQIKDKLPKYEKPGKKGVEKGPKKVKAERIKAIAIGKEKKVGVKDIELSDEFNPVQGEFTRLEVIVPKGKTLKFKEKTVVDSITGGAVAELKGRDAAYIITAKIGKGTVIPAGTKLELKKA
ncbi:hypothetical protein JKY72_05840 [Candidatus Gracilibacteria bacterium]|nr:hypothetical protein [Candidatus Gracilibacteria bacterium]